MLRLDFHHMVRILVLVSVRIFIGFLFCISPFEAFVTVVAFRLVLHGYQYLGLVERDGKIESQSELAAFIKLQL